MKRLVLVQRWSESEREPGWGVTQRSDGYSLHASEEALKRYLALRTAERHLAKTVPNCYDFPDGAPYIAELSVPEYRRVIMANKDGVRCYDKASPPLRLTEART